MTNPKQEPLAASLLAAALLLPGVQAQAQGAPENGSISVRYLDYADRQSGLDRIHAHSPSVSVVAPVASDWVVEGTLTADDVSGASPRYHTAISGASHMQDERRAGDISVTRTLPRASVTAGAAFSTEHDYVSRTLSLGALLASEDNNTTWAVGLSGSDFSRNGGRTWTRFDEGSLDTVDCANPNACWASGANGRVAYLTR